MKVVLKQDVKSIGKKDELHEVSDGYARNYLLPRGLAVAADAAAVNEVRTKAAASEHHAAEELANAQALAKKLNGQIVAIKAKAGQGGRLFGSVTSKDIAAALTQKVGEPVDKRKIVLDGDIKNFGSYEVEVKVYPKVTAKLTVKVEESAAARPQEIFGIRKGGPAMPANNRSAVSGGLNLSLESLGVNLPYSMEAEQAVLGAAILDADIIPKMVETLRPEMFYARQNGEIFSEIVRLFTGSAPVDFVTLLAAVQDAAVFETEDAAKVYLTQLAETVPSLSHTDTYVKIIAEKYRVRQLMNAAKTILEQTGEETDADLLLESAEQKIYEIRSGRDSTALTPISSVIIDTYAHLQEISGPNKDKYLGIPTGFNYLDTMLTGLGRSDLIILAARPGMGKTSFALNIATNVAKKQNVPVAVFSLEMTKDQLVSRILSSEAAIDSQAFRTGGLSTADWEDLARASEVLAKTHIYLDDTSNITIPEMKAKIRRINQDPARPDIGLLIIDYLQLMSTGKRTENRVQEISEITRNLKIMAKELNVPVIALSQLSRSAEKNRTDHRPVLSDLRDSGSIEQDADVVLFLYRDAYYDNGEETDATTAECIVAKNRHGEVGKVDLGWDGAHTRFTNVDYAHG